MVKLFPPILSFHKTKVGFSKILTAGEMTVSDPLAQEAHRRIQFSKLNLVDLAGSERVHVTGATGTNNDVLIASCNDHHSMAFFRFYFCIWLLHFPAFTAVHKIQQIYILWDVREKLIEDTSTIQLMLQTNFILCKPPEDARQRMWVTMHKIGTCVALMQKNGHSMQLMITIWEEHRY